MDMFALEKCFQIKKKSLKTVDKNSTHSPISTSLSIKYFPITSKYTLDLNNPRQNAKHLPIKFQHQAQQNSQTNTTVFSVNCRSLGLLMHVDVY